MIYKNNYQRKQAVWREKQRKKNEERLRKKARLEFQKVVTEAGVSLREAFTNIADVILKASRDISEGLAEVLQKPEVIEALRKAQEEKERYDRRNF